SSRIHSAVHTRPHRIPRPPATMALVPSSTPTPRSPVSFFTPPPPPPSTLFPYTTLFRSICSMPHARITTATPPLSGTAARPKSRSEEHTSELQSRENLVCRLLLEKKKQKKR